MKVAEEMINHDGPCVVEFLVETNESVYPMVAPGKGLHEMELGCVGSAAGPQANPRELGTLA